MVHFELSIHQKILKKFITVSTKILFSTTIFNIKNKKNFFSSPKSAFFDYYWNDYELRYTEDC